MILSSSYRFVYIHIPKCGGDALTDAYRQRARPGDILDTGAHKHLPAAALCRLPAAVQAGSYLWVTAVRNPWALVRSDYYFSRAMAEQQAHEPDPALAAWYAKLRRTRRATFAQFVQREYLHRGQGLWSYYCQDAEGRDLVQQVLYRERLAEHWLALCARLGIPPTPLRRLNVSSHPAYQDDYTPELRDAVGEKFADWIGRFGYGFDAEPPGPRPLLAPDGRPQGWFSDEDARLYREAARQPHARIVEVGTWLGRSLCYILPQATAGGSQVWCVDRWTGSPAPDLTGQLVAGGLDAFAVFQANMRHLGWWGSFRTIRAASTDAARAFGPGTLDLVFLDAEHSRQAVLADIDAWWPKVRCGGKLMGHDYGGWPGVTEAVHQRFGRPEQVSGTTWAVTKSPGP